MASQTSLADNINSPTLFYLYGALAFLRSAWYDIGRRFVVLWFCAAAPLSPAQEDTAQGFHGALRWRSSMANGELAHPVMQLSALPGFRFQNGTSAPAASFALALDLGTSLDASGDETRQATYHKVHRFWLGYGDASWRVRLGRGEIRFGPARIMRVLDWFDRADPRDPFSVVEGVDAVLFSLGLPGDDFTLNTWGIFSSSPTPYVMPFSTSSPSIAPGGRLGYPLPAGGQGGLALHRRMIDRRKARDAFSIHYAPGDDLWEGRVGSDGKWLSPVELWYEASLVFWQNDDLLPAGMDFVTIGAATDRRADWQISGEVMAAHIKGSVLTREQTNHFAACALDVATQADQRISFSGVMGVDVKARLWSLDYWIDWPLGKLGAGWYQHDLPTELWGISGTMLEPASSQGDRGVRVALEVDY